MTRRRRAFLLLALALLLGSVAASDVARREAAARRAIGPYVGVVVTRGRLAAGTRLDARMLALAQVPAHWAPVAAAREPGEVIGRKLTVPLPGGAYLSPGDVQAPVDAGGPPVGPGERAVTIVGHGQPGLIVPGGRVDVLVTRQRPDGSAGRTTVALAGAEVLEVRRIPGDGGSEDPTPRVQVSLRARLRDALRLAAAQSFAQDIRLLPRPAADAGR